MITGLEAMLVKGGAGAAKRAVGWTGRQVWNRVSDRRMLNALENESSDDLRRLQELVAQLPERQQTPFAEFATSPELQQCLFALSTERALRVCGKRSDARVDDTRRELDQNLRLALGDWNERIEAVADALFDICDAAVTAEVHQLLASEGGVDPKTRARLVKTAAQLAGASVRNADVLLGMQDLAAVRAFEKDLKGAVAHLHGSMRLPHAGTTRQVPYDRLFVPPSVNLPGTDDNDDDSDLIDDEQGGPLTLGDFVATCSRTVLLGNPGGGKSTSSLKLVYDIAAGRSSDISATVPFLVVLRDYAEYFSSSRISIVDYLASICEVPYSVVAPEGAIEYLLLNGRGFVIFDGLDELLDTSLRREVVAAVEGFAYRYPLTPILVTSRLVGYEEAPLDSELFTSVKLEDFSDEQVEAYTRKWFSLDESIEQDRKQRMVDSFLGDSQFVRDLRVNPLMLSLMCGIYSSENYIPRNRPDVYEKCALLLFDRWDKQRGINAPLAFDAHVQAAMRSLALWLYPQQESQTGLPRKQLIDYMTKYLLEKRFDLAEDAEEAATQFIDFCKGRAWVLTDVGAELYGFTHRTFLEYFAASQLVRIHHAPDRLLDALWAHLAAAEWDVVAQLAVQMIGKSIEDGADDFLALLVERAVEVPEVEARSNYLSFACRALEFVVPRPPVMRQIVEASLDLNQISPRDRLVERPAIMLLGVPLGDLTAVTAENLPLVQRYLRESITERLADEERDESALLFALHPMTLVGPRSNQRWQSQGRRSLWGEWARENRQEFFEDIKRLSDRYHWVAAEQVRAGLMSVDQFIDRFGVRGLFDYHMAGRVAEPPIAYEIVSFRNRARLTPTVVSAVLEALLQRPTPWLARDDHYSQIYGAVGSRFDDNESDKFAELRQAAAVLCGMPIWEMRHESASRRRQFLRFMEHRSRHRGEVNKRLQPTDIVKDERVLTVLLRWLDGDVSFTDPEQTDRLVPKD